ncbi:acetyl-CoA synthetase-like protein [Dichomitus squalens LYAD-421 SS1]|uniref:Acetyl-CoA synthetase-like protein n=1 Tax=Dichomitus squalens (strain LYAD-421) TaxID=732165 RepID=R7SJ63_DICSQ|nr:acetyl-CoA synthetase-like protein [Dichomitus squalens LYAD-421 SS1]EJF55750.1 acetyl-CoA synthetase-like protein [Dichomitus squalens LYAD-421 SS1]
MAGKLTIPDLFEWHATENPDYPLYRFHDGVRVTTITYAQAIKGIRRAARYVKARVTMPQVVAVIANVDTITCSINQLGIMRAGYPVFPISPRNVPAAVADMLRKTECRHILISSDAPIQELARAASEEIDGVCLHEMPVFEQLFPTDAFEEELHADDLPASFDMKGVCVILHSSGDYNCLSPGSTNHPKPIRRTHKKMMSWSSSPWYGDLDLTQGSLSVHGIPMFHSMGAFTYCVAATNGMPLGVFLPKSPPTFPTPENVFEGIVKTSSDYVMSAPAMIEFWAREPAKVQHMKTMKGLMFGGAPLDQGVGDTLASHGINLYSVYGSTETGLIARIFPGKSFTNPGMDWAYFQLNPINNNKLVDAGGGRFELIIISDPEIPLPIVNIQVEGKDAYATSDILEPHPTRSGWYKYYGRVDDQIVLSNGEKTNPGPLEKIISEDPHIQGCIIFGQGKFQNGVLVEPTPEYRFDPRDLSKLEEYRNRIWESVERANAFAPSHSRLFKEMIMVTSPEKPFPYNIKGYPRRKWILEDYKDKIAAIYAMVEETAQSDVAAPTAWDHDNTRGFLRAVVERVLKKSIADDADFFRNGCDRHASSATLTESTWIRNTLLRAVRESSPALTSLFPINIVYQSPTISALTEAVLRTLHSTGAAYTANTADDLVRVAEKYSSELPARPTRLRPRESSQEVVLITGTTGGFGCDVLEHLLRDERVERVYAFNRPGSQPLERQLNRFRERALDESLLSTSKFRMVEVALDVPGFGIGAELLGEIRDSITHIMHNAWTVNFNMALSSFEPDLKAVRNLVELALSSPYNSPPRIQFTSSVGVFRYCDIPPPIPEVPLGPSSALGSGYTESKWIAEQVLYNVAKRAGVPVGVVRLGQIGGNKTGHWNEREWLPSLIKSASLMSLIPTVEGVTAFLLSYPAARAFLEMRSSPEPILHLVHPRPVSLKSLLAPIAKELKATFVSYADWLDALEAIAERNPEAAQQNPAVRLLSYFRATAPTNSRTSLGLYQLSTVKAVAASETLANMPELGEADAIRWVAAWRASGFLPLSV